MARTADHNAASSTTARRGSRRPAQQQRAPESEAAVVLTPDGQQWLLARAAWLASQPDQAGWGDEGYARGAAELARLHGILGQAITTEELPPEQPGVVELGDEVTVEFAASETERFLLVDPVEAPLDQLRISVESPLAQALLGRRVGEQVEVRAPAGRYAAASSPPAGTRRHRPRTATVLRDGRHLEVGRDYEMEVPMALKCVTCGLLFRNRSELDWHIRQEHLQQRLPPIRDRPTPPAASSKGRR